MQDFQFFAHNMPLPWQRTFCHCRKMCLAHLHPKTNICAKFHENRSKTEEVVRDANLRPARPTDRPTNRRHADSYIPPYTLRVCGGIIIKLLHRWSASNPLSAEEMVIGHNILYKFTALYYSVNHFHSSSKLLIFDELIASLSKTKVKHIDLLIQIDNVHAWHRQEEKLI